VATVQAASAAGLLSSNVQPLTGDCRNRLLRQKIVPKSLLAVYAAAKSSVNFRREWEVDQFAP